MTAKSEYRVLLDHVRTFSEIERYGLLPGHLLAAHRDDDVEACLSEGLIARTSKPLTGGMVVDGVILTDRGSKFINNA
jgi:hypothetical protein